jgi:hypothetical protein
MCLRSIVPLQHFFFVVVVSMSIRSVTTTWSPESHIKCLDISMRRCVNSFILNKIWHVNLFIVVGIKLCLIQILGIVIYVMNWVLLCSDLVLLTTILWSSLMKFEQWVLSLHWNSNMNKLLPPNNHFKCKFNITLTNEKWRITYLLVVFI